MSTVFRGVPCVKHRGGNSPFRIAHDRSEGSAQRSDHRRRAACAHTSSPPPPTTPSRPRSPSAAVSRHRSPTRPPEPDPGAGARLQPPSPGSRTRTAGRLTTTRFAGATLDTPGLLSSERCSSAPKSIRTGSSLCSPPPWRDCAPSRRPPRTRSRATRIRAAAPKLLTSRLHRPTINLLGV